MTKPDICSTLPPPAQPTSCGCRAVGVRASSCPKRCASAATEARASAAPTFSGWGWLLLLAAACAPPPSKTVGSTQDPPEIATAAPATVAEHPPPPPVPDDVVERAALPFHAVRSTDGEPLDPAEFWNELAESDVVCVAEQHDNPHHRFAQLFVIQEVARRSMSSGRELGEGFEMFEARFQESLKPCAAGKLDLQEWLERTEW